MKHSLVMFFVFRLTRAEKNLDSGNHTPSSFRVSKAGKSHIFWGNMQFVRWKVVKPGKSHTED